MRAAGRFLFWRLYCDPRLGPVNALSWILPDFANLLLLLLPVLPGRCPSVGARV